MELSRLFDCKKYMWDGKVYDSETENRSQEEHYRSMGFDVKSFAEDDKYYLFTRRVVLNTTG